MGRALMAGALPVVANGAQWLWLNLLVPAIAIAVVLRAVWVMAAMAYGMRAMRSVAQPADSSPTGSPRFVVLLPMLREQSVAATSVQGFLRLRYPMEDLAICVITTEREEQAKYANRGKLASLADNGVTEDALRGFFPRTSIRRVARAVESCDPAERGGLLLKLFDREPTTRMVIEELRARGLSNESGVAVIHLHQPAVGGRKAGQLNHAIANMDTIATAAGWHDLDETQTYVVVYDADGLPDERCLLATRDVVLSHRAAGHAPPDMVQQQRLPILTMTAFPSSLSGLVLVVDWLYQLRRCLAIELGRLLMVDRLRRSGLPRQVRALLRPMTYGVGCGMAVRLSTLRAIQGFPEPMEDVCGGFRLSLLGTQVAASRTWVADEPYTDLRGLFNLLSLAYTAYADPAQHRRAVADVSTLPSWQRRLLSAQVTRDRWAWAFAPVLCVAALASVWWVGQAYAVTLLVGVLLAGPVTALLILAIIRDVPRTLVTRDSRLRSRWPVPAAQLTVGVLLSPLGCLIEMVAAHRVIVRNLLRKPIFFGKTER
jgi:hypothetical protein